MSAPRLKYQLSSPNIKEGVLEKVGEILIKALEAMGGKGNLPSIVGQLRQYQGLVSKEKILGIKFFLFNYR